MVAVIGMKYAFDKLKFKSTPTNDNPNPEDGPRPQGQEFVSSDPANPNSPLHNTQAQADPVTEARAGEKITNADVPDIEDSSAHVKGDRPT